MLRAEQAETLMTDAFGAAIGAGTRFVAIAGRDGLRWVVPTELGAGARALANWRPYKRTSQFAWAAIQIASRAGVIAAVPGAHSFSLDLSSVSWRRFGWTQPHAPLILAYVGTVGAHQKLVCNFIDPKTGDGIFVVKFPVVATARDCLKREYATLGALVDEKRDVGPKPLRIDDGSGFTVQSFVDGRPDGVTLGAAHLAFQIGLLQADRHVRLKAVRDDLLAQRDRLAADGSLHGALLQRIDKTLNAGDWSGVAPQARTHGDFAPWNLKRRPDGSISAVDWEDSRAEDLPYIDLHHFRFSLNERLGRTCDVPWEAYTAGLMRADPTFSAKAAATTFAASEAAFLMRGGFVDGRKWRAA